MVKPRNAEEWAFWDAAFIAGMQDAIWVRYIESGRYDLGKALARTRIAAQVADESLEQRRERTEADNATP